MNMRPDPLHLIAILWYKASQSGGCKHLVEFKTLMHAIQLYCIPIWLVRGKKLHFSSFWVQRLLRFGSVGTSEGSEPFIISLPCSNNMIKAIIEQLLLGFAGKEESYESPSDPWK